MGSGARRLSAGALQRPHLDGKAVAKAALLDEYGLPADGATMGRPIIGMISRMVDQKGFDLIEALAGDLHPPRRDLRGPRHRRPAVSGSLDRSVGRASRPHRRAHRLRRAARASDRGGRRHLPDAVAIRAVRPQSDVQSSVRHGAGGPGRRRACGHGRRRFGRGSTPGSGGRGFVFREYTPEALLGGAAARAWRSSRTGRRWRALQMAGMAVDHSWDRSARSTSKYTNERSARRALG